MSTEDVAKGLVALCKAGKFDEAGEKYWDKKIVSREAMSGDMARIEGIEGVRKKSEWWNANHEVHSAEVGGPYINGDQFAVRFTMDVTAKESGQRMHMDEVGVYTVKNDKIVEEAFFMSAAE